jgi:hypothetical protein
MLGVVLVTFKDTNGYYAWAGRDVAALNDTTLYVYSPATNQGATVKLHLVSLAGTVVSAATFSFSSGGPGVAEEPSVA